MHSQELPVVCGLLPAAVQELIQPRSHRHGPGRQHLSRQFHRHRTNQYPMKTQAGKSTRSCRINGLSYGYLEDEEA